MSMAEPLMPHPEDDDTALDQREEETPEDHGEPAEANEELTSAGRAREQLKGEGVDEDELADAGRAAAEHADEDLLPRFPAGDAKD